jgi:hypothetical protein
VYTSESKHLRMLRMLMTLAEGCDLQSIRTLRNKKGALLVSVADTDTDTEYYVIFSRAIDAIKVQSKH